MHVCLKKTWDGTAQCLGAAAMLALFGASSLASAETISAAQSNSARPNVLIILADDLGYSDLSAYGSEIPTPNLDALAGEGRLLTNHYVNPTCSPSRASLLSGSDSHVAGLGTMAEYLPFVKAVQGKPGYEGYLNERVHWLPEMLRVNGYHTYMAGKWHLGNAPGTWPNKRGFEHSFVLLQGGGSHFSAVPGKSIAADRGIYVEDGKVVQLPENFYSSKNYTDKLINYIRQDANDGKPFFAYAAYTAPHWPLQAPDEDIEKFRGHYDAGYEVIRAARLARMKALGIIAQDFKESAPVAASSDYPTWDMLSLEQKQVEAKKMEVYAAMVSNMDSNIGRLINTLKETGQYDNTAIIFMSDNGAEATPSFFPNNEHTDNSVGNIGRRLSNVGYGMRWAEVSATPFRYFKGYTSEGGIASPAFVRLPGQSKPLPALTQPTHISDIAPTVLELTHTPYDPTKSGEREVVPMTGNSLAKVLKGQEQPSSLEQRVIAGELFGGRYVRDGEWKAVSIQVPFSDNQWKLFNIATDRGETRDVSAQHPEVLKRLVKEWDEYAHVNGVVFAPSERMPDVRFNARSELEGK